MTQHDDDPLSGKESERSVLQHLAPFLSIGFQLAATVIIFFFAGRWLDGQLQTAPWCMIVLLLIGMAGGFYRFFVTVYRLGKEEDKRWKIGKHDREVS
jgi:F0F1-type ATP synthase assembly protein I